jgi:hypothetical protein
MPIPEGHSANRSLVNNRTGLRHAELEIGKSRPETPARNPPRKDRKAKNRRSETGGTSCKKGSSGGAAGKIPHSCDNSCSLNWNSPDDSRIDANVRVFPAFLQDRTDVRTAIIGAVMQVPELRFGYTERVLATCPRHLPSLRLAEIAEREAQGERHIRLLAPLAFLSPCIIAAIVDGTAPADLTVTGLAKAVPYSWAEREERIGLSLSGD